MSEVLSAVVEPEKARLIAWVHLWIFPDELLRGIRGLREWMLLSQGKLFPGKWFL